MIPRGPRRGSRGSIPLAKVRVTPGHRRRRRGRPAHRDGGDRQIREAAQVAFSIRRFEVSSWRPSSIAKNTSSKPISFATFRERIAENISTQDVLDHVHQEILSTTRLPLAIQFLATELKHSGLLSSGFGGCRITSPSFRLM